MEEEEEEEEEGGAGEAEEVVVEVAVVVEAEVAAEGGGEGCSDRAQNINEMGTVFTASLFGTFNERAEKQCAAFGLQKVLWARENQSILLSKIEFYGYFLTMSSEKNASLFSFLPSEELTTDSLWVGTFSFFLDNAEVGDH